MSDASVVHAAIRIDVRQAGFGNAPREDIQAVLASAATELTRDIDVQGTVRVVVVHGTEPITSFTRGAGGAFRVTLAVEGLQWAQFAYQFSHELCHVLSLNRRRMSTRSDWFEESLCEAASLVTVRRMARTWRTDPPYPNWRSYAPSLDRYVVRTRGRASRRLPAGETVGRFYACRAARFAADPYDRERNGAIANTLVERILANDGALDTIRFMNRDPVVGSRRADAFFRSWRARTPASHRGSVDALTADFVAPRCGA